MRQQITVHVHFIHRGRYVAYNTSTLDSLGHNPVIATFKSKQAARKWAENMTKYAAYDGIEFLVQF